MARNILQDIVPPEKRSIRNVTLPERARRDRRVSVEKPVKQAEIRPVEKEVEVPQPEKPQFYPYPQETKNKRKPKKIIVWSSGLIAVILIFVLLSSSLASAVIKVTPRNATVNASNEVFKADTGATEGINLEIVEISKEGGEVVPATGEERVERKASGTIVIYNNFDDNNQRLIRNTRFQTPEGLIYRIDESVVVPGRRTDNGSVVPGSVEVTVFADEPGDRYNISLKDFTIPGFSDDPGRFKDIYARSKTEMTGGFVGTVKTVSSADEESAKNRIRSKLESDLRKEVSEQIPEGFVLFDDAIIFDSESLQQTQARGDSVQINEMVVLKAIIIKKSELANALAERLEPNFTGEDSDVINWENLTFSIQNKESLDLLRGNEVSFVINGEVGLIKTFDENSLRSDLAGNSKKNMHNILSSYQSIERAQSFIKPFWKRSFPKNEEKISVEIEL